MSRLERRGQGQNQLQHQHVSTATLTAPLGQHYCCIALCIPFSHCYRFEINFLSHPGDQIAFHFNPRFASSRIVCNSFLANHWGKEEVNKTFPFEAKEPFQVALGHTVDFLGWGRSVPANTGVALKDLPSPFQPALYPVRSPF